MPCRPAAGPFFLLVLAAISGCTDSKPGQSDAVVPRWRGTEDLAIGSLKGEHKQFGAISGIASDRHGRIFIADADNHTIAVFDSGGHYLFSIGREGSGPGELKGPCCLALDAAGDLWVHDAFNSRYHRYAIDDAGAMLRETRPTMGTTAAVWSKLTFDGAGRLIGVVARPFPDRGMQMVRLHIDSTGTASQVDTITAPPNDSLGVFQFAVGNDAPGFISQPYGPRHLVAQAPGGGWAEAVSSRYLVRWIVKGDSAATRTIRRDLIGPALSARERQEADSALKAQAGELGRAVSSIPFGVPGSKTPVYAIMFDDLGRLWVQLNVGDGEASRADVWDASGRRVGNAEWPAGVGFRQGVIGEGSAYGVRQDSAGILQVVRVRFSN